MAKKSVFTRKQLEAAYTEFDDVVGPEPSIDYDGMSDEEFGKKFQAISEKLIEEGDEFTPKTQTVINALNNMYGEKEEDEDEEEAPAPKKSIAAPKKGDKKAPVVEDEDDEDEDDDEDEAPAPKKKSAPVVKGKKAPVVEDEDDEDEDEDDEPAPVKKPTMKIVKGKKAPVVEDEDDDEDEDEDEAPAPKKGKAPVKAAAPVSKKKAPVVVEEDEDDDEDDANGDLYATVKATTKKQDLVDLITGNDEFKKKRKALLAIGNVFSMKSEMLKCLPAPEVDEAPVKKATPVKKAVVAAAPVKKAKAAPVVEEDDDEEEEEVPVKNNRKAKPTLTDLINGTKDRNVLLALYKGNKDKFEGLRTKQYDTAKKLQAAMLEMLEEEEEEAPAPVKKAATKAPVAPAKKAAPANVGGVKNVGIGEFIVKLVVDSGEEGISRQTILKKLAKKFPDRDVDGMKKSVWVTVPLKMTYKGFNVEGPINGDKYRIAVKKGKKK